MGNAISYCHACGRRLLEDDFREGRASLQSGRRLCTTCHPVACPPVPASDRRKSSSTRIQNVPAAARRNRETTKIRKKPRGLILAFAGTAAAALVAGIAIGAVVRAPAPETPREAAPPAVQVPPSAPKPDPGLTLEEVLRRVRELRADDLMFERRDEVLRLLRDATERAGTRREEIDQIAADYDRKFEQAAERLADFVRSEALRLSSKRQYAEALARLDGYPAAFRASRSAAPLRVLRDDLERRRFEAGAAPTGAPQRYRSEPASNCPISVAPRRLF